VKGTRRALAISLDGNGRYGWLDPKQGAMLAVAEACRNVAASGAVPIGATNCLNFGNPEKPEIMGQLVMAIRGIGEACRALDAPITGGNVSLYNETDGKAIYPTPVIGVVGLLEDATKAITRSFRSSGAPIFLLGATADDLGGSEYLKVLHDRVAGRPPKLDLAAEKRLHVLMAEAAAASLLLSAHDLSDGGFAVALAECCLGTETAGLGASVELPADALADHAWLFSESPSRMIVEAKDPAALRALSSKHGVPCAEIGRVGGDRVSVVRAGRPLVDLTVARALESWMSLESRLQG